MDGRVVKKTYFLWGINSDNHCLINVEYTCIFQLVGSFDK